MGNFFQRGGGQDTGNQFLLRNPNPNGNAGDYTSAITGGLTQAGIKDMGEYSYGQGAGQVQSNPIQSQLFGPGGQLQQTNQQVTDLSNRGYSLKPEDYEAYGQASGNIARMFGSQEQGAAQDLANRGMSNSGAAGQQFSGIYGNKMEQLGQLQTNIAQQRMQMNQQRLGQMQNFLSSLGGQSQNAINSANQTQMNKAQGQYNMGTGLNSLVQNQNNEAMSQRLASQNPSTADQASGLMALKTQQDNMVKSGFDSMSSGMSAIGGMSDKNVKTNIQPAEKDILDFFKHITPYIYNYIDPKHGKGTYVSPMAQDLEKSKLGKDMIINTPEGKYVDYGRAIGLILAAQAMILKKLEVSNA